MSVAKLHDYAMSAEENLSKLATGLAAEAVDPEVVKTVERLTDVVRRVVRVLGSPEAQSEATSQGQTSAAPSQPAAVPTAPAAPVTLDQATQHLHEVMRVAAQQNGGT